MTDTPTKAKNPTLELNDGRQISQLGFGTFEMEPDEAEEAVKSAVEMGYWLVDTAAVYRNEKGVGRGLGDWSDIFLQTKIWNEQQGYDEARTAFEKCLGRLGRDHVDMLLIHWPCPENGKFIETWKAFVEFREEGRAKSIGVSNFLPDHLKAVADATGVVPAINQVELHPTFQQAEVVAANKEHGTLTQCWSPLGRGESLKLDTITDIAKAHDADPAAVVLAWQMAKGWLTIPKASSEKHRRGNLSAVDVTLSAEEVAAIDGLDRGEEGRIGPHPLKVN